MAYIEKSSPFPTDGKLVCSFFQTICTLVFKIIVVSKFSICQLFEKSFHQAVRLKIAEDYSALFMSYGWWPILPDNVLGIYICFMFLSWFSCNPKLGIYTKMMGSMYTWFIILLNMGYCHGNWIFRFHMKCCNYYRMLPINHPPVVFLNTGMVEYRFFIWLVDCFPCGFWVFSCSSCITDMEGLLWANPKWKTKGFLLFLCGTYSSSMLLHYKY